MTALYQVATAGPWLSDDSNLRCDGWLSGSGFVEPFNLVDGIGDSGLRMGSTGDDNWIYLRYVIDPRQVPYTRRR